MPSISAMLTHFVMGSVVGAGGVVVHTLMTRGAALNTAQAAQAGAFMGTVFAVSSVVRER